jgi:hypothetical protein
MDINIFSSANYVNTIINVDLVTVLPGSGYVYYMQGHVIITSGTPLSYTMD